MASPNPFNVYKGPDGLKDYFNPDKQPPLPLVELPAKLNPFCEDGVRIYAKLLTALPAQNVKALPALNMLLGRPDAANKRIVEASSGSTVTSLGISARVLYDNNDTTAFCTNKTERNRLRQLQFFGLHVELYGGPAQPEFTDKRGIIERVRQLERADPDHTINPAQYDNENNWKSHLRWTGPQLWRQIPEISVFCMGMGSTGCVTGTGKFLKSQKPSVKVLGVCNAERDPIPGPRALPLFDSCSFPWRGVVDFVESVGSVDAYRQSMQLSREGIIAGPSSGMALQGLFRFLQARKSLGKLDQLRDAETGEIHCVFVCCDLPQQYLDGYFDKLGPDAFHAIKNEDLLDIDQDVYDLKWEVDPSEQYRPMPAEVQDVQHLGLVSGPAGDAAAPPPPGLQVVDLRSAADFAAKHTAHALNLPLAGLGATDGSPFDFDDTATLKTQWAALQHWIGPAAESILGKNEKPLLVLDYAPGDTARMATAVLRKRGFTAFSFMGGFEGLEGYLRGGP